jgi:cell wall-associated NlpC family hydrolase
MTAALLRLRRLCALSAVALALVCGGTAPAQATDGWTWPLQPAPSVARPFDPPSKVWSAGHRGVDLRGSPGQPVLAPVDGRVAFAADLAGRGVVVVEAGGLRVTLEPVAPDVRVGEPVSAGQVLGHLQTAQSHCLPAACLHWGVKAGPDSYVDPLGFVGGGTDIVLLPVIDPVPPPPSTAYASAAAGPGADAWTTTSSGAAAAAVRFALAQVGDPYVWAAAGPDAWDCSGLTMQAWAAAGRPLPHYSAAQYLSTTPITEQQLRPGDLVFWSAGNGPAGVYHVAMYLGGGRVVHAPRPGTQVRIEDMRSWAEPDYFSRV